MNRPAIKIIVRISLITAAAIILFQLTGLLFMYKYFKFDYYLAAVGVFFLGVGLMIARFKPATTLKTDADPLFELTAKELSILQLIADGKSNKEIAVINYIEVSTVKTHINNIYAKLGLSNRKEAIRQYKSRLQNADTANIHPFST